MPKYEDLEFLHDKILNIGNEAEILKEKNIPFNTTPIPGKIKDSQVEVEKEILNSGDLLKDITEDFKETIDIEENFSDMKEEKVDDFLSSLTTSDITSEEEVVGAKTSGEETLDIDTYDLESIDKLSDGNEIPKNIFEKKDLSESQRDWESLKNESLSDLDLLNMDENTDESEIQIQPESMIQDEPGIQNDLESREVQAEPGKISEESDLSDILGASVDMEAKPEISSSGEEIDLDDLVDDKAKKFDNLDDLLKNSESTMMPEAETPGFAKEIDDGLVDLAGDFASQEEVEGEKSVVDQTLSELFPEEKKDEDVFDSIMEKSEVTEEEPSETGNPPDDLLADLGFEKEPAEGEISVEEKPEKETISTPEKPLEDFDLTGLDNLADFQEKDFEIEKHEISEEEIPGEKSGEISLGEENAGEEIKEGIQKEKKPIHEKGMSLTDADRKKIVTVLARLPKEAELKIAKAIVSDKYSDNELRPLINVLIAGEKSNVIFKTYERLTGDRSLSKIEISKYTGEEFQKYQSSFSYQFKKNVMPIISLLTVIAAVFISLVFIYFVLVEPTITASVNYAVGKNNLREKKFNDVERYFEKAFAKQKRYNEVVEYGDLYRQYKRYAEAEKKYDLAFSMKPNNTLKMKIAGFFRELGRYESSAKLYGEVLYNNDKDIKAFNGIARTYYDWSNEVGDKLFEAIDYYKEAVTLDEKNTEAVMGLMSIFIRQKDDKLINDAYKHAETKLKKIDPGVYADLAGYFIDQEKFDEVKKILGKAAKDSGKAMYPEIDYQWARYKKHLNISGEEKVHLENAVRKLENMRENDPNRYELTRYKIMLASAYNDLGENYDRFAKINIKAEEYFIKATQVYPEYGKAWFNLGIFEMKNKVDYAKALAYLNRAEENGFTDDRQTYLIGWLDYKDGDFLGSFGRINSLLEKYPENDKLKLMVGTIFYRMGKYDLAESLLAETYDHFDKMKQTRSPLSMNREIDRNIVNMLISLGNNLGATLQKKYEETGSSKHLISATRYYSSAIENFGKLKEIPDSVLKEEITEEDFNMVKMNKFPITDVHINLRMVLYPKLGVEDPKIYEEFPMEF